jgi:hypothetical protein
MGSMVVRHPERLTSREQPGDLLREEKVSEALGKMVT